MNRLIVILFAISSMALISCGDDSPEVGNLINYDGENSTSPLLPAGENETAVYFPSSFLSDFEGRRIKNVQVLLYELPLSLELIISDGSSASSPRNTIYQQPFIGLIRDNAWNFHTMVEDVMIDGSPLWVRIRFSHDSVQQTIGCDAGPGIDGGDWLYQENDEEWRTFLDRTGESINWNIRIELDE